MYYTYKTPGVYFEWLDRPPALPALRTDIAGFVGIAARGPLHRPVKVESWTQFVSAFGTHLPQAYLAYGVEGFFANGGRTCWVVRIADPALARPASLELFDESGQTALRLTASSPGVWGHEVAVTVNRGSGGFFSLRLQLPDGAREVWPNLTLKKVRDTGPAQAEPRYIETVLNDPVTGSRLVTALALASASPANGQPVNLRAGSWRLQGGQDGLAPAVDLVDSDHQPLLRLITFGSNPYGQNVTVTVAPVGKRFNLTLQLPGSKDEPFNDLTMEPADPRYAVTVLNDRRQGSRRVMAQDLRPRPYPPDREAPTPAGATVQLSGGLTPEHFSKKRGTLELSWGLATLEAIDEVSIIAIPDIMRPPFVEPRRKKEVVRCDTLEERPLPPAPAVAPEFPPHFGAEAGVIAWLQGELIKQCELLKDRFAILDLRPEDVQSETPLSRIENWRNNFDSKYAALYFPWIGVPDPLRLAGLLRTIPPSGHVAGVYARVDQRRGVHKPPANESLEGIKNVSVPTDDRFHGDLNERSINAIRAYNGRGIRIAGARTLSSDSEWRYINIRRLLMMIAEAIDEGTQWTVFEPHNTSLWIDLERVIRNFLLGLWQRGMLDGATAEEAFSVRCDETTNPPEEVDQGRVICEIGLNPPWPAEFVIVRIGKTEGGLEILEERRG